MKIKLVKAHGSYRKGEVIELDARLAAELVADGRATPVPPSPLIETASLEFDAETADATPRRRVP